MLVHEQGQGLLEDNEITTNAYSGVLIRTGANPTLRTNRITGNAYWAVYVRDGGMGTIDNNDLRNNKCGAWNVSEDCVANLRRPGNKEK